VGGFQRRVDNPHASCDFPAVPTELVYPHIEKPAANPRDSNGIHAHAVAMIVADYRMARLVGRGDCRQYLT